jgi:hypothetical protein
MDNNYVIFNKKLKKWYTLNMEGDEIILVDTFKNAYRFQEKHNAILFVESEKLNKEDLELYKLNLYAQPIEW